MTGRSEDASSGQSATLFDPRSTTRWRVVDAEGTEASPARSSPAAALAAAPVIGWPLTIVGDDGSRVGLAQALGPGGDRVADLLDALGCDEAGDAEILARSTPAGPVGLPLATVTRADAVEAAGRVDSDWLAEVDRRRTERRRAVVDAGREEALEAALHVAVLVATERFDPSDDLDADEHVASGARLWLLTGAVVSALSGVDPDPFAGWARLVAAGWWPVGPSEGHLVVCPPA